MNKKKSQYGNLLSKRRKLHLDFPGTGLSFKLSPSNVTSIKNSFLGTYLAFFFKEKKSLQYFDAQLKYFTSH